MAGIGLSDDLQMVQQEGSLQRPCIKDMVRIPAERVSSASRLDGNEWGFSEYGIRMARERKVSMEVVRKMIPAT